ncbi:MAG TPA: sugar transferase [Thermoanaerobaculia bacterium]|nr:sugar transferase [Thermoanaerobaculia bacterium]
MQKRTVDRPVWRWAAVAGDAAAALAALALAREIRLRLPLPFTESLLPAGNFELHPRAVALALALQLLAMLMFGLYGPRARMAGSLSRQLLPAQAAQLLGFATVFYFFPHRAVPRSVLVLYLAIDGFFLYAERAGIRRLALSGGRRRVLIVGNAVDGEVLADAIRRHPWTGIDIAEIVRTGEAAGASAVATPEDLSRLIDRTGSDHVLFAPEAASFRDRAIEHLALSGRTSLWVLPSPYETLIGRLRFRPLGELPLLEIRSAPPQGVGAAVKRAIDVFAAAAGLLLLSPVLAAAALAVWTLSGRPVLFRQERVGRDGKVFRLLKLRTMRPDAEEETGAVLASRADPRVTRVGRWLRTTRIDEIPQLVNVLRGEMSLVGPRPERPEFVDRFEREIPGYALRFAVRPGLTGFAQISGEYDTSAQIKLRYDLAYVNNWSLAMDAVILARTLPVVLSRRGF